MFAFGLTKISETYLDHNNDQGLATKGYKIYREMRFINIFIEEKNILF
jgi:hypothetical protein